MTRFTLLCLAAALSQAASAATLERYIVTAQTPAGYKTLSGLPDLGRPRHALRYHAGFVTELSEEEAAALAAQYQGSLAIEKDTIAWIPDMEITPVIMPYGEQQEPWGMLAVRANLAREHSRGGGVTVCVVDTGVDPMHPDLGANVLGGELVAIENPAPTALSPGWADRDGHGTHVAGTIAAMDNSIGVVGVAPRARIFAVRALPGGFGTAAGIAEGIRSCIAHETNVINLSLVSGSDSALIHDAIRDARARGIVLVAAAGNSAGAVEYPARYPEVIAVANIRQDMKLSGSSSHGREVRFAAPGDKVISTLPGGRYGSMSGTSMAAPHVSGVAALMLSSGTREILGRDIGLSAIEQGRGLVDALATVVAPR